jgi:hypothetical protein
MSFSIKASKELKVLYHGNAIPVGSSNTNKLFLFFHSLEEKPVLFFVLHPPEG